jgi:hypothetical protein
LNKGAGGYAQAIEGRDLLEALAIGDVAGSCHRTQAGTSDSSCTVVGVTAWLAVTFKDAAKDSSDWKYEEEVELHNVLIYDTWGSDLKVL